MFNVGYFNDFYVVFCIILYVYILQFNEFFYRPLNALWRHCRDCDYVIHSEVFRYYLAPLILLRTVEHHGIHYLLRGREVAVTHYTQQEIVAFLEIHHLFTHCLIVTHCGLKKQGERQCVETPTLPLRSFAKLRIIIVQNPNCAARICRHTIAFSLLSA